MARKNIVSRHPGHRLFLFFGSFFWPLPISLLWAPAGDAEAELSGARARPLARGADGFIPHTERSHDETVIGA